MGSDLPVCRKNIPDGMLTVAFTDIEGSTEMMERLGENRWLDVMSTHNRIVRDCVEEHGGEVIKSRGDGFMVTFASASAALDCAVELQRMLSRYNSREPARPVRVRVGMHTGNIFPSRRRLPRQGGGAGRPDHRARSRRRDPRLRRMQGVRAERRTMALGQAIELRTEGLGIDRAGLCP